jgi:hypothetical protein
MHRNILLTKIARVPHIERSPDAAAAVANMLEFLCVAHDQ